MNLDDELRGLLSARAEDAPSGADLLDRVRARRRRLDLRYRLGLAGVAAAVGVAVAIGTPYVLSPLRGGGSGIGASVPPGPVPSSPVPPSEGSTVALVAPAFAPVAFPLSPQWTPPGAGRPAVGRNEEQIHLGYTGQSVSLFATVGTDLAPPDWTPATSRPVSVGTRPGTLATGTDAGNQPAVRITWQLPDQRWVDLRSSGVLTAAQVERYADNLRPAPLAPPLPFALSLAPRDYEVIFQEIHPEQTPVQFQFCLAPPASLHETETWLCLSRRTDTTRGGGDPVQVGPDPGTVRLEDGRITIAVDRPGFAFEVRAAENGALSREDLIRFAAGVH